jgi:hypothetical protein
MLDTGVQHHTRRRELDFSALVPKAVLQRSGELDPVNPLYEIDEPMTAMKFAVGTAFEANLPLQGHGTADLFTLDGAQLAVGQATLVPIRSSFVKTLWAQKAADNIGSEGA